MTEAPCPFCGNMNPLTVVLCRTCDRKLPGLDVQKTPRGFIKTGIRLLFLLASLGLLVLVLQSSDVEGELDTSAKVDEFYRELVAMDHAIRRDREEFWTFTEGQANAYLQAIVEKHAEGSEQGWRKLKAVEVNLRPHGALLGFTHAWGPLVLSQRVEVSRVSASVSGEAPWEIDAFYIGKLPLPKLLQPVASKKPPPGIFGI